MGDPGRETPNPDEPSPHALVIGIAVGAVLGGLLGWLAPSWGVAIGILGELFFRLLRALVVPLVVVSMVCGVTALGDVRRLRGLGGLTIGYYVLTSSLALVLGLVLVNVVQPGVGVDLSGAELESATEVGGWREMLKSMFAPNLVEAAANTDVLPLILFSLAFGAVLTTLGDRGHRVIDVFEGLNEAIMKLVQWVMWTAPVGIFGLVAGRFGEAGGGAEILALLEGLGLFAVVVIAGLLIHATVVLGGLLLVVGKTNPLTYARNAGAALLTAVGTASSVATLPVTMQCTTEENGVPEASSRFVLPLGATINMDGTALYEAVAAVFVAQALGLELSLGSMVLLFVVATVSSVGAAGIPEAGLVTMVIVFEAVGLPLEPLGLLLTIDWFLDRFRTGVNVWGDAVGAQVVGEVAERRDLLPSASEISDAPLTT